MVAERRVYTPQSMRKPENVTLTLPYPLKIVAHRREQAIPKHARPLRTKAGKCRNAEMSMSMRLLVVRLQT